MAFAPGVGDVGKTVGDAVGFAGFERDGLFEALAEFPSEGLAADQFF